MSHARPATSDCIDSFGRLRSNRTIAEPWDEADGCEWAKVDVSRVAEPGFRRCHHRRHAACVALHSPARATTAAGGWLGDRHMPGHIQRRQSFQVGGGGGECKTCVNLPLSKTENSSDLVRYFWGRAIKDKK